EYALDQFGLVKLSDSGPVVPQEHVVIDTSLVSVDTNRMILSAGGAERDENLSERSAFKMEETDIQVRLRIFLKGHVVRSGVNLDDLSPRKPTEKVDEMAASIDHWGRVLGSPPIIIQPRTSH